MPTNEKSIRRVVLAILATLLSSIATAGDWQAAYPIGTAVELKITDSIWQKCKVSENTPGGLVRVFCEEYIEQRPDTYSRAGGTYIVYGKDDLRRSGNATTAGQNEPTSTQRPAIETRNTETSQPAAAQATSNVSTGLRLGEYACYGSGGRILAGFGFIVLAGGRYTDMDASSSGSFVVAGDTVTFHGGHLDETVGRALSNNNFRIGAQADCEPF